MKVVEWTFSDKKNPEIFAFYWASKMLRDENVRPSKPSGVFGLGFWIFFLLERN
jgi:hypothetical protein